MSIDAHSADAVIGRVCRSVATLQGVARLSVALCVVTAASCTSVRACQFGNDEAAGSSRAVWQIESGDSFIVAVVVRKKSITTVGDKQTVTSETTDRFRIEYRVARAQEDGDAIIAAILHEPTRDVADDSSPSLRTTADESARLDDAGILFQLAPDGAVLGVSPSDREQIIGLVSNGDERLASLLSRSLPNDVMAGWLSRPFWLAVPEQTRQSGASWSRLFAVACGPFGTMQHDVTLTLDDASETPSRVSAKAESRFVPLVLPAGAAAENQALLSNVQVTGQQLSVTGTMMPVTKPEPAASDGGEGEERREQRRPGFESLELGLQVTGIGELPAATESAEAGDGAVRFELSIAESWMLESSSFGRPELMFGPLAPVVPAQ